MRRNNGTRIGLTAAVFMLVVTAAGCGSGGGGTKASTTPKPNSAMPWPPPADPMARTRAAGLVPETAERLQYHVHAHLDVFIDGKPIVVPGGIGIDTTASQVHTTSTGGYPSYGGITTPCDEACISPLHTHDATGVLHTESSTRKNNTLGQFLTEWNATVPKTAVTYVNGKKFKGDIRTIPLSDLKEIAIVIGAPPDEIPSSFG